MSNLFGVTIEALVAVLLLLTILYCARLDRRIRALKSDEQTMRKTIGELLAASDSASRAIAGLRQTAQEADERLGTRLRDAEFYIAAMTDHLKAGEDVLSRLRKIAYAGQLLASGDAGAESRQSAASERGTGEPTMADAAKAFADRARLRVNGYAA